MIRAVTVGVFAFLTLAGRAEAQLNPEPNAAGRRNAVYGIFGFATPVGFVGLEGVRHIGSVVEIAAGLGAGLSALSAHSGSPLQWSVMPRLRFGQTDRGVLTLGAGVSGGNLGDGPLFCDESCDSRMSYPTHDWLWANVEAGGEHWLGTFALRYFVGYGRGCEAASCDTTEGVPYFGMGFGRAF